MTRRRILLWTLGVYGALAALGFVWAGWRGRAFWLAHPAPWVALPGFWSVGASVLAGLALTAVTLFATRVLVRRSQRARELHLGFRELVGDLDAGACAILALASGVGEEVFFRAAMQPELGLTVTSVVFGLLHIGPDRRFLLWTPWALAMGFALGAIYQATGSLAGCVLAHVVINYENLRFIATHDPRTPSPGERGGPRLVSREERR